MKPSDTQNVTRYLVKGDEKRALARLAVGRWQRFSVQGGAIARKDSDDPTAYLISGLQVDLGVKVMVCVHAEDDIDRVEYFRMAAVDDPARLEEMNRWARPRYAEITNFPADLELARFLRRRNKVALIRFCEKAQDEQGNWNRNVIVDDALLVSNGDGRMLLRASQALPLDLSVTTAERSIDDVLSRALEIERLGRG